MLRILHLAMTVVGDVMCVTAVGVYRVEIGLRDLRHCETA
jgi:hypothetical protein